MRLPRPAQAVRAQLGAEVFARVAGPDGVRLRTRIHGTPGPRRFAADEPICRVHGDASMFVGGMRALMLQALHPAAMAGVADHSNYREDMWGRLARTSAFIATTTYATETDADAAIAAVRRIHERIVGTLPDGTPYEANDPALLRWVHVAEIDSFLTAHRAFGAQPLSPAETDTYVAQTAYVAEALGADRVPHTAAELDAALAEFRPQLRATPAAREAVRAMLISPPLSLPARLPYATIAAAAISLMPTWTRFGLRLPWLPIAERTLVRAAGRTALGTLRWAMTPGREAVQELHERAGFAGAQ